MQWCLYPSVAETVYPSIVIKDAHARRVTSIAREIRAAALDNRRGKETRAAQNKCLLNRIPWPLRRPVFRLLKWISVDMGIELRSLGLSANSFGSFVVSDIGSFGLQTGMTALMPAAKVPAVIVLGKELQAFLFPVRDSKT
jgi:pyruvate dehydrogenase E2 component (dihydrolipoamide acetyltransferase)